MRAHSKTVNAARSLACCPRSLTSSNTCQPQVSQAKTGKPARKSTRLPGAATSESLPWGMRLSPHVSSGTWHHGVAAWPATGRGVMTMQTVHAFPVGPHGRPPDKGPAFKAGCSPKHHTLLLRQGRPQAQNSLRRLHVAPSSGQVPELAAGALAAVEAPRRLGGAQVAQLFLHCHCRHLPSWAPSWVYPPALLVQHIT